MKLKDKDIIEIAKMIDNEISLTQIALKFNYSLSAMKRIVARYKKHGLDAILHSGTCNEFAQQFKLEIINRYYNRESKNSLAIEINASYTVVNSLLFNQLNLLYHQEFHLTFYITFLYLHYNNIYVRKNGHIQNKKG